MRESTLSASVDQKSVYKSKKPWTIHQEMQGKKLKVMFFSTKKVTMTATAVVMQMFSGFMCQSKILFLLTLSDTNCGLKRLV